MREYGVKKEENTYVILSFCDIDDFNVLNRYINDWNKYFIKRE